MRRALVFLVALACAPRESADDGSDDTTPDTDAGGGGGGGDTGTTTVDSDTHGGGGGGGPASSHVDATCTDGAIVAPMPTRGSLAAAKAAFDASGPLAFAQAALDVRWPTGRTMLDGGMQGKPAGKGCFYDFTRPSDRATAAGVVGAMSTVVHECGHTLDLRLGGASGASYRLDDDHLIDSCPGGSYATLPARSRILDDAWAELRPPCVGSQFGGCDMYAAIYLDGDPTDGTFDSGDQALDMLLEETVQYVHSLATDYAFEDQLEAGTSITARDGILTFLWYTERYLHLLRTSAPAKYDAVLARPCWRDAILLTWGSAWAYLDATKGHRALGIDDAPLLKLVEDPDLLDEIQRVRDAEGCP